MKLDVLCQRKPQVSSFCNMWEEPKLKNLELQRRPDLRTVGVGRDKQDFGCLQNICSGKCSSLMLLSKVYYSIMCMRLGEGIELNRKRLNCKTSLIGHTHILHLGEGWKITGQYHFEPKEGAVVLKPLTSLHIKYYRFYISN